MVFPIFMRFATRNAHSQKGTPQEGQKVQGWCGTPNKNYSIYIYIIHSQFYLKIAGRNHGWCNSWVYHIHSHWVLQHMAPQIVAPPPSDRSILGTRLERRTASKKSGKHVDFYTWKLEMWVRNRNHNLTRMWGLPGYRLVEKNTLNLSITGNHWQPTYNS